MDESHGVTGVVMQVLMEVLDSGQFLPFGATSKRAVECAVIFASNRSWETLRGMIHIDKRHIEEGIKQWEPKEQKDAEIYTSYG